MVSQRFRRSLSSVKIVTPGFDLSGVIAVIGFGNPGVNSIVSSGGILVCIGITEEWGDGRWGVLAAAGPDEAFLLASLHPVAFLLGEGSLATGCLDPFFLGSCAGPATSISVLL